MSNAHLGIGRIYGDVTTPTDGSTIVAYLANAAGTLFTSTTFGAKVGLDVNNLANYAEDTSHTTGDIGSLGLAVRRDANTTLVDTDGDYAPLQVNAAGALKVAITTAAVTTNYEYAEDSAHTSGQTGAFVLAVRQDTTGSLTSANGDYSPFAINAVSELKTSDKADSTMLQQLVSVANTATPLPATALANRKNLMVQNIGTKKTYIGSATVTSSGATQGLELPVGGIYAADVGGNIAVNGIVATGTNNVIVLELS